MKRICCILSILSIALCLRAQRVECSADWSSVGRDSLPPLFSTSLDVGTDYRGYDFDVQIAFPVLEPLEEGAFVVHADEIPAWPEIDVCLGVAAKRGQLDVSFLPLIRRDGRLWKMTDFDLTVSRRASTGSHSDVVPMAAAARYAAHSRLASGHWKRVEIAEDGLYLLTPKRLHAMGFKEPARVRVYGYGGHLLPEWDLAALPDDLPAVTVCRTAEGIVFWGNGVRALQAAGNGFTHVNNHYARAGSYFLTEEDSIPLADPVAQDVNELLPAEYKRGMRCVVLENDVYAFHPSGRKLFDSYDYATGATKVYDFKLDGIREGEKAYVTLAFAHNSASATSVAVAVGGTTIGTLTIPSNAAYSDGHVAEATFETTALTASSCITLTHKRPAGTSGRLDFLSISYPASDREFVPTEITSAKRVDNQDLHALEGVEYVIVVPASGIFDSQAERLAEAHRRKHGLRTEVVSAREIFNEFSSGTPDATAIRRFMKMLYDRAETDAVRPRYLLLFGDGAWDNRMLSDNWRGGNPDDYLLCFQSENSFSSTRSFVMEDYFALLDDHEGKNLLRDKPDIGVGRFPVSTAQQARDAVDKTIAYMNNTAAGAWKNTILMMGDDGDNNQHMDDAEFVAQMLGSLYPKYMLKRIYWDTYPMEVTATGNSYPAVHKRILEMLDEGALMVNYSGHGSADVLSHELVVSKSDMENLTSPRLPLWVTASCDISPFDNTATSFGEYAFLNPKGGAIALFTSTRTVFSSYNRRINHLFSRYVFGRDSNGRRLRLGDAVQRAKVEIVSTSTSSLQDFTENKLHFVLLGDPALIIGNTDYEVVVDALNGRKVTAGDELLLSAGQTVTVEGHIADLSGALAAGFHGTVHPTVLDNRETVVGRNNAGAADEPFSYSEHTKVLFTGSDSVRGGTFTFTFRVPLDINYSGENGLLNLYAIDNAKTSEAQGFNDAFLLGGTESGLRNDSTGPAISMYLNTPSFVSGDKVNETPLLVATLEDADGINTVGNGIGHDLVAVIDGEASLTYKLNNYYTSAFGDYTRGMVAYSIPALSEGQHTLMLRAWDMMNNSGSATIDFEVVKGLTPVMDDITVTHNPAVTETTFVVSHDRPETAVTFLVEVFDFSGRILWSHEETTATSTRIYTTSWNLCNASGAPLTTGIYLYRVTVSSATGNSTSAAHKLMVKH